MLFTRAAKQPRPLGVEVSDLVEVGRLDARNERASSIDERRRNLATCVAR
jgi:hypothetical protein